jgi:hypothetical protein
VTSAPTLNATPIYPKLARVAHAPARSPAVAFVSTLVFAASVVAAATPVSDADMRAATERLLVEVGKIRRLAPRAEPGSLERRVETRAEARARRAAELAAAAADPELGARVRLWERLGLVPAGVGPERILGPTLDAAPVASYDPLGRRLAVPDWIPLPEQRPALAHALAHALADQRFGIRDLLKIDLEGRHHLDGDAERARLALVEGDAALTALELDDARGALTSGHALPAFADAIAAAPAAGGPPAWPRAVATFVHAEGLAFVARVRARRPWSAVDALWADPPQSSEQVLHPETYDAREAPVAFPPARSRALAAYHEIASDVLGELGARTWLARAVPEVIAERAAAGWGGDRAFLLEAAEAPEPAPSGAAADAGAPARAGVDGGAGARTFALWWTTWDDVTDAEDFAGAAASALARLAGARPAGEDDPHRVVLTAPDGTFALAWRGSTVAVLAAAPASALPALDELVAPEPAPRRAAPRPKRAR